MKEDDAKIEKFLESLFDLDSDDFGKLQDVLLARSGEESGPIEGETPAEAARRRTLDEKRKNIANAFFASLQENPAEMVQEPFEALAPVDRPISETKSMTLLAVSGPSHALIPGDTTDGPAFVESDDMGSSLLPMNDDDAAFLGIADEVAEPEASYDDMLSALLISEEQEEASIRLLEEQKQHFDDRLEEAASSASESIASFDPVPLIALSESDMISAMLPDEEGYDEPENEQVLVLEPSTAKASPSSDHNPEAAFLREMFKDRPHVGPPVSASQAALPNAMGHGQPDASMGRALLAGPAAEGIQTSNPLSFDAMESIDDGVLTFTMQGDSQGPPPPPSQRGELGYQPGFPNHKRSTADQRAFGHSASRDELSALRAQANAAQHQIGGDVRSSRPGVPTVSPPKRPPVATNSRTRQLRQTAHPDAPAAQGSQTGPKPNMMHTMDQHGLMPMNRQTLHPNAPRVVQPQAGMIPMGGQVTGNYASIGPHTTGSYPAPALQSIHTGGYPAIHSGVYQMVDGVPVPLHIAPTGVGPASIAGPSSTWEGVEDWSQRSANNRLYAIIGGVLLGLVLVVFGVWMGTSGTRTPQAMPRKAAPVALPAVVKIRSQPVGAAIFLGDIATGKKTPASLRLAPGKHTIILRKKGYVEQTEKIKVTNEKSMLLQLSLARIAKPVVKKVTLYVTSRARKATVWLNGKKTSYTTPVFLKVVPGSYAVQVRKKSYQSKTKVIKIKDKSFYHVKIPWR